MFKLNKAFIMTVLILSSMLAYAGTANALSLSPPSLRLAATAAQTDACAGLSQLNPNQSCNTTGANHTVTNLAGTVTNILSTLVGVAATIMLVYAGYKYITSSGDSNKVSAAKSTLLYSLVGLAIAATAQLIVHEVLTTANQSSSATSSYAAPATKPPTHP